MVCIDRLQTPVSSWFYALGWADRDRIIVQNNPVMGVDPTGLINLKRIGVGTVEAAAGIGGIVLAGSTEVASFGTGTLAVMFWFSEKWTFSQFVINHHKRREVYAQETIQLHC